MRRQLTILLLSALAAAAAGATPAYAHGFGQRYELPLPLGLYLFGAASVVALSFVMFGLFVRRTPAGGTQWQIDILATPLGRMISDPGLLLALRLATLILFVITILAGFLGDQNPYRNIAPTLVWIIWWVGLAYVTAFVGDLWVLINPWRTVFDAAQWVHRWLGLRGVGFRLSYPPALGAWPACALLLAFAWIELVYPNAASPVHLAALVVAYSMLTWAGMLLFGRDVWLANGEVFSLFFSTLARFAPLAPSGSSLQLRPYGRGLLEGGPVSTSLMAFVLLMLSTVLYDGLTGTGEWAWLEGALRGLEPGLGEALIRSVGLVAFWLLFLGAFIAVCAVMARVGSSPVGPLEVARTFALTLVPIAIGYHVAHYLVFLLVQGQYVIPLASDPFGRGWDLFGTAAYRVDIAVAGARVAWYAALAAIVTGHILAVYLAHLKAIAIFAPARVALATQVPLTALMVVYTFVGLSITAQPIVESRAAAEPATVSTEAVVIPADALLPEAGSGRLQAVGADKSARLKITYKVLGSAFHDGSKTGAADILYAYAFAYRWGTPPSGAGGRQDHYVDVATAHMRRHLLGVRVIGTDATSKSFRVGDVAFVREVLTIEVYLGIALDEPEASALVAPPWSTLPWPLLVLMEAAVDRGWAAFSAEEARRRGVAWLDLVRSKELLDQLALLAAEFEREGYRPDALRDHVGHEEARRRWAALLAFYRAQGHLLVTNGPYRLKNWSAANVTLEAFRDLTYPLGVGSYDAYAIPRRGFITGALWSGSRLTISADIEAVDKFQRSYRLVRTPLPAVPAPVLKRAAPECRYLVTDAGGRAVLAGVATPGAEASFRIEFEGPLPPGRYTLSAQIAVNGNVMNSSISRIQFEVPFRP